MSTVEEQLASLSKRVKTLENELSKPSKKVKDPNRPKRPPNAYMCFVKSIRPQICEENPGKSVAEIAQICGKLWKELSDTEKLAYKEQSDKSKL
tara:strand:- start:121 stop:402 length:282 start_codon:yes stop_codon:yes gene_type:complete